MLNFIKYYFFVVFFIYLFFWILMPERSEVQQILEVCFILPMILFLFIPKLKKNNVHNKNNLNLGLIYIIFMAVIMIIGNINNYIVRYIYPSFGENISLTNYYWMGGMVLFAFGFIHYSYIFKSPKIFNKQISTIKIPFWLICLFFSIGLIATGLAYLNIGFIPLITGAGTGLSYTGEAGDTSLIIRLWSLNILSAVLAYIYFVRINKNLIVISIAIFSFIFSLFFIIRIYPALILLSIALITFAITSHKKNFLIITFLGITLFILSNHLFLEYRTGGWQNPVMTSAHLNHVQKTFYTTFNEYRQLNIALNDYDAPPQYGRTLLGIPVGFFPAPFLEIFNISKRDIQMNNSAVLMADHLGSVTSTGIRIGILGEFYINYKYYGFLFMYFVGLFIGFLQYKINNIKLYDYRFAFYIIFFSIMIYSLIGQSNALGSLLANNTIVFIVISLLFKLSNKNYKTNFS